MHVAICIVGFRNAEDISRCLRALAEATHRKFEVVICENGGADAYRTLTAAIPGQLPGGQNVRAILARGNLGYAGGVNLCIRSSPDADAWWVLNPDTIPEPEALACMVRKLEAGECDIVGSLMYHDDGSIESCGGRWRPWLARAESVGRGRRIGDASSGQVEEDGLSYIPGASMLASRRFVEKAGLMREDYFLYCEEVEWGLRGLQEGLRLGIAADALVLHHQGSSTGSGGDLKHRAKLPIYLDERNKMLLTREHFPLRFPVAAGASFLLIMLRYARRGAWKQAGYALGGWWAGLSGKRGVPAWLGES